MDFSRPLTVITPTLDGDVLAVLAGAQEEFTGRRVHSLVGYGSERGVRNALERLTGQGIVCSRKVGAAKAYRLNRQHLASPWVEGLASMRSQLLQRLREAIEAWEVAPVVALLFGSVARGEATSESDLDLLVVRPQSEPADSLRWESQVAHLEQAATAWTGNDARVLEFGERELLSGGSPGEPVLTDAVRDGVPVYGTIRRLRQVIRTGTDDHDG